MTLVPLATPRPLPPKVSAVTAEADSEVSCQVAAFAGSAAAPIARALPSSGTAMTPTALLRLKCMVSGPSQAAHRGRSQTVWPRGPPGESQIMVLYPDVPPVLDARMRGLVCLSAKIIFRR